MKKFYFLSTLFFFSAATAFAQVTLDQSNVEPTAGNSYTLLTADSGTVDPGASGADVTWDFSGVTTTGTATAEWRAFDASITPDIFYSGGAQPDYTLNYDVHYQFFAYSSSGVDFIGRSTEYQGGTQTMPYNSGGPVNYMDFPFNYQDQTSTNVTISYNELTGGFPISGDLIGDVAVEYDGYGEVIMPDGKVVSDVARLKVTETFTRDLGGQIETVNNEFYEYREAFTPTWIIRLEFYDLQVFNSTDELLRNFNYFVESSEIQTVSELIDQSENLVVYPNPTPDQANVSFDVTERTDLTITVTNIMGMETIVHQQRDVSPGSYNEIIDLSNFAKGYYLIKVKHGKTIQAQRIQKL